MNDQPNQDDFPSEEPSEPDVTLEDFEPTEDPGDSTSTQSARIQSLPDDWQYDPQIGFFPQLARTLDGLEQLLADELEELGAEKIEIGRRWVAYQGTLPLLYEANLRCALAIRILIPVARFPAASERELYSGIFEIDWAKHLRSSGNFFIDPTVHRSFCTHSLYAAQLTKDAIVDQFRQRFNRRPNVDREHADLRIALHLHENIATVYLDSSGDSLHKRGYRVSSGEAPLNEVLAAAIVRLTGWDRKTPFVDPMCGSGTLLTEAALWATDTAPGLYRREFGFQRWPSADRDLFASLSQECVQRKQPIDPLFYGGDIDPSAVRGTKANFRSLRLGMICKVDQITAEDFPAPPPPGTVVTNPPYDERMKIAWAGRSYRKLGSILRSRFAGYSAFLFTGHLDGAKQLGLKVSRRTVLFNGPIECRLLEIPIFEAKVPAGSATAPTAPDESTAADDVDEEWTTDEIHEADADDQLLAPPPAARSSWDEQADLFRRVLAKRAKHWQKWARRQNITCFRLYNRDVPEFPFVIDWYEGNLHIAEFDRPHDRFGSEHEAWLERMLHEASEELGIPNEKIYRKQHAKQKGLAQHERLSVTDNRQVVHEGGLKFWVNFEDYLNTGLFLDHRLTRKMIREQAAGANFLNLFGYTGSFTVYAAAGGAAATTTIDLSSTYLDWTRRNLMLNDLNEGDHQLIRSDAINFLRKRAELDEKPFDLSIVDVPTHSRSKRTEKDWDVQRDHVPLLELLLAQTSPGGKIYFSTNFQRFHFDRGALGSCPIGQFLEITGQTVPPDFVSKRATRRTVHRCWLLIKAAD